MTNVESVHHLYAAFLQGQIPAVLEKLHPDVEWEAGVAAAAPGVPYLVPGRGRAHAAAFFTALAGLEFKSFEITRVLGDGDVMVALCDVELVVRATGKTVREKNELHLWKFDDQGRIVAFRHGVDTHAHVVANAAG
jgi:ketosteroid isomerase-like protein